MDRRRLLTLAALGGAWLVAGCDGGAPARAPGSFAPASSSGGVLDVARANDLTAFVRAVETAGLTEQLSGSGPYTLFVPSDAAFRSAGISPTGNREALRQVLAYHVVPGQVGSSFMTGMTMNHLTSSGATLAVDGRGGRIRVNDANVVRPDLAAGNGVVHIVDRVLRPA